MRLALQRAAGDCGVAALASLLEQSYEDAYVAVSRLEPRSRGKGGLQLAHVIRAAKAFGITLRRKPHPVLDDDEGVLVVNWRRPHSHPFDGHLVVLGYGVIADPADGIVLPADEYLARFKGRAGSLLEVTA